MLAAQGLRLIVAGFINALARSVNSMTKTTSLSWHRKYMYSSPSCLVKVFSLRRNGFQNGDITIKGAVQDALYSEHVIHFHLYF